jgi:hypothetical protein
MGEAFVNDFPYEPLDTIRLLRLSRGESGHITGILCHFSMTSPDCPEFTALSYVWGFPKSYSNFITLNGHRFYVLDSLFVILETICDDPKLVRDWWWIDSISINQAHDPAAIYERSAQVQLMDRIYANSARTVGWLGDGAEGEAAMDFMKVLFRHRDRLDSQTKKVLGEELEDREKWASVERLLLSPWWRRVWTLQEYIVARKFIFYCGKKSMDREDIKVATFAIWLCRKIDSTLVKHGAFDPAWVRRRLYMWYRKKTQMSIIALAAYMSACKATDPKDRLYSLLGLAKDRYLVDPPNYMHSERIVYSELVKGFVEKHKSLDIICFTHGFNRHNVTSATKGEMPSWVPDWRAEFEAYVIPVMASQTAGLNIGNFRPTREIGVAAIPYTADGGSHSPLLAEFSNDLRFLTCRGVFVDLVDGLGGLRELHRHPDGTGEDQVEMHELVQSTAPANIYTPPDLRAPGRIVGQNTNEASAILETISRCLVLNRKDRYLSHPTPSGHFLEDFLAFCLGSIHRPHEVPPRFISWFLLNKFLYIGGHTLEELCEAAPIPENPQGIDYLQRSDEESFQSRHKDVTEWMARRLMTTKTRGLLGMAPCRAEKGDQIWVLRGCSIPMLLRKRKQSTREEGEGYEVIGECYLHGYMDGEIMKEVEGGKAEVQKIVLS